MSIADFIEGVSYAYVKIFAKSDGLEECRELDIDHVEEDDNAIYFYGDTDDSIKLFKKDLSISFENDTFNLIYPHSKICIKIIE